MYSFLKKNLIGLLFLCVCGNNYSLADSSHEDTDAEFAALLEGKNSAEERTYSTKVKLSKVSIDKNEILKIKNRGDLRQLKVELEKKSAQINPNESNENAQINYYALAIDHRIAQELLEKVKASESFFVRVKNYFRRHAIGMASSAIVLGVVGAYVIPTYLAPLYSKYTGYKYEGIPYRGPRYVIPKDDVSKLPGFYRLLNMPERLNDRLEYDMDYMQDALEYAVGEYMVENLDNNLRGIAAPPNTYQGGAKMGAMLGVVYYLVFSNPLDNTFGGLKSLVDAPNKLASFVSNKFFKLSDRIDNFFYRNKSQNLDVKIKD